MVFYYTQLKAPSNSRLFYLAKAGHRANVNRVAELTILGTRDSRCVESHVDGSLTMTPSGRSMFVHPARHEYFGAVYPETGEYKRANANVQTHDAVVKWMKASF